MCVWCTRLQSTPSTELKVLNAVDPHRHTDDTPSSTIASQSDSQFQHGIPTINKVTLDEMSEYVSSCHAHNNTEFSAQFQVLTPHNVC